MRTKKIFFSLFVGLLVFWIISLFFPSPSHAVPCPPLGTNLAANFDRENLEFIAQNANCDGPIPITVIITPAMVQNPEILVDVQNNLRDLGFNPTWRPWGFIDPDNTEELNAWLNLFRYLEIGQLQAWNEWNRYREVGDIDPARDARLIQALINARNRGLIKIPIGNTPLDLLNWTDMNYQTYWKLFFEECPDCIDQLDFIVSNVYPHIRFDPNNPQASVDAFLNLWRKELSLLKSLGVNLDNKFFIISEAGLAPGAYPNFEERLKATLLFAQALEDYILSHPGEFPNLEKITFLLMNDDTGEIFLIYRHCDETGCRWLVRELLAINFNVPGSLFSPFSSLSCNPQSSGARDSRPDKCDPCNTTSYLSASCATSFTVYDTVSYKKYEGGPDEPYCVERDWGGMVIIDPSNTTIPFVGKKENENEQLYLADYFEGTNEYYEDYSQYWLEWVNHAGVYRKLTPMEYQDELKKEMVQRAQKTVASGGELMPGGVHDYKINYSGRLCWDIPFLADALLALAKSLGLPVIGQPIEAIANRGHYCLFEGSLLENFSIEVIKNAIRAFNSISPIDIIFYHTHSTDSTLTSLDGHFPPELNEENYLEKWRAWKNSEGGKWFNLWSAVPMFSRNDTPGEISPYLGRKSADGTAYIPIEIEKVPHLARLFEETLGLNELLLPEGTAGAPKFVQNEGQGGFLFASLKNNVLGEKSSSDSCSSTETTTGAANKVNILGEKALLAQGQGDGCFHLEAISQISFQSDNRNASIFIHVCFISDGGDGDINLDLNGRHIAGTNRWNKAGGNFCYGPEWTGSPFNLGLGNTLSVTYTGYVDSHSDICPDVRDSITCFFEFNGEGSITTNCGPGEGLENEVCEIWGPIPVADCFKDAIKDTNPNDDLCCEPIQISLSATDAFINKDYTPCGVDLYDCHTNLLGIEVCKDHCEDTITESVNRRFGINLAHPYLNEIWNLSTNNETYGIFNIFRPAGIPQFEDLDASSEITYSYCQELFFGLCLDEGTVIPGTGEFYFNHLGGIQKTKEWVTTKVLMPYVEQ